MNIQLKVIEKFKGYLVVEYKDQYFRLCNFTYENNRDWDLMELIPNYYSFYHQDVEKMNKKIYNDCNYDAEHMGTYKTKKEALKSLFNYIIINK